MLTIKLTVHLEKLVYKVIVHIAEFLRIMNLKGTRKSSQRDDISEGNGAHAKVI